MKIMERGGLLSKIFVNILIGGLREENDGATSVLLGYLTTKNKVNR